MSHRPLIQLSPLHSDSCSVTHDYCPRSSLTFEATLTGNNLMKSTTLACVEYEQMEKSLTCSSTGLLCEYLLKLLRVARCSASCTTVLTQDSRVSIDSLRTCSSCQCSVDSYSSHVSVMQHKLLCHTNIHQVWFNN